MRSLTVVSLVFLIAAFGSPARADDRSYVTGDDYMNMSPAERTAYILGAHDMQARLVKEFEGTTEAAAFIERVLRCTASMTTTQLRDYIDEYMARDATYRTYTMASNFRAALHEKCPP